MKPRFLFLLLLCFLFAVPVSAAEKPKVTTTIKISTKKEKMKKASKVNKKTTKTSTKNTTRTTSSSTKKVVEKTKTETTVETTLKKWSKIKTIKTTVKTTIETTTKIIEKPSYGSITRIEDIKKYIDKDVYDSFQRLGFQYIIDPKLSSTGVFSLNNRWIKLKSPNGTYLMHELGHFVSLLKQEADSTSEWKSIYKKEKSKYTGFNKDYTIKNAEEYFAESFREYSENPAKLKKSRPKTYAYMDKIIKSIDVEKDTEALRMKYYYAFF